MIFPAPITIPFCIENLKDDLCDTGGWYALTVPTDPNHATATAWLDQNTEPLFTTDYIVDETLTLLRARGEARRALEIGERFFDGSLGVLYRLSNEDIIRAWQTFQNYRDKGWSFTDCSSKAL